MVHGKSVTAQCNVQTPPLPDRTRFSATCIWFNKLTFLVAWFFVCVLFLDDTGCPSSQSVSPVKTPPDAGISPVSFCTASDGDCTRKKFNSGTMGDGTQQTARYKKETKTTLIKPGKITSWQFYMLTLCGILNKCSKYVHIWFLCSESYA